MEKPNGLNANYEIIVPMNPCENHQIQIRLRYTDNRGEIKEIRKNADYRMENCDAKSKELLLKEAIVHASKVYEEEDIFTSLALAFLLLLLLACLVLSALWRREHTSRMKKHLESEEEDLVKTKIVLEVI